MFDRLRADQKMATPMSGSQAKAVRRATVEREHVDVGSGPSSVRDVLRMSGRPLDPVVRETFGSLFGHDFSGVRVHSDETAASAAADVGAKAFTQGQHIVLGGGSSAVHAGGDLLAHELTHVVQQHTAPTPGRTVLQREPEDDDRLEQRAREKAATLRRTQERATAGKELGQLTSREAEAELRDLENSYRRAGATSRSVTRKAMDLERYRKLLSRTGLTTLEKSQRQGAFDELQRTPRTTATPPQSKYVAGGPQLPDQELRPGRETYAQPDYSLYRRRPDGTLERIHVNLKSDDLHALSAAQSRARARAYVAQAVRNSQHLGEGESIEISFAQTPSREIQAEMNSIFFAPGSRVSAVKYGTTTHPRPATPTPATTVPSPVEPPAGSRPQTNPAARTTTPTAPTSGPPSSTTPAANITSAPEPHVDAPTAAKVAPGVGADAETHGSTPVAPQLRTRAPTVTPDSEAPPTVAPSAPPLRLRTRVGGKLREIGAGAAMAGATLAVDLLAAYLKARLDAQEINKEIQARWPQIAADLNGQADAVAALQAAGKPAFANVKVTIIRGRTFVPGDQPVRESVAGVERIDVTVSAADISEGERPIANKEWWDIFNQRSVTTWSFPVSADRDAR